MSGDMIKLEVQGVDPAWPMYTFELNIDKAGKKHIVLCFKSNTTKMRTAMAQTPGDSTTGNLKVKSDDMMVKQELVKLEDMIKVEENGPRDLGRYIRYIPQHSSCNY
ncbi:hypothetical protein PAXRUDRAFT_138477 [Paxillus rubicundulus Ve08.2h10]|uniref:Uncharacterized protein n=1 Tax=Paxillus rubicundulus Ve08.2h10 TaxID=930991 RepID=A0A0D0EAA6_9AGAM|nr:hypothetical protein PAXRUDRAFT_138477 [Paxillus rubicundulus Ve08.2h10]